MATANRAIPVTPLAKPATVSCPRCNGQLVKAEDGESACLQCGFRQPRPGDDLLHVGRELRIELEPHALESWPPTTARARQYDELVKVLLRYAERGEGIRYRLTPENRSLCGQNSLRGALDRAGHPDKSVSVLDRGGYRYLRLVPRTTLRKKAAH